MRLAELTIAVVCGLAFAGTSEPRCPVVLEQRVRVPRVLLAESDWESGWVQSLNGDRINVAYRR
jgi:hypothetical protein